MDRNEIIQMLTSRILSKKFHWLDHHFLQYQAGLEHVLAASIVNCCEFIENKIPGFTERFSNKLASFSNSYMFVPHYEQIIQVLAELMVINHLCNVFTHDTEFMLEPSLVRNGKNPELGIRTGEKELYIEVKCRKFVDHHNARASASIELPSRINGFPELAQELINDGEVIVYPRDNVVKDFLISANEKFKDFKLRNIQSLTILVIVWDDFVYEAISSLLNRSSGLLTDNSFYKDDDGSTVIFDYIDAIVLIRHSHHIVHATRDEMLTEHFSHPLEWSPAALPKAYIPINTNPAVDEYVCKIFQAFHINALSESFADYRPQDLVFRIHR